MNEMKHKNISGAKKKMKENWEWAFLSYIFQTHSQSMRMKLSCRFSYFIFISFQMETHRHVRDAKQQNRKHERIDWIKEAEKKSKMKEKKNSWTNKVHSVFLGGGKNFVRCIFSTETVCFFHFDVRFTSVHQTFVFVVFFTSNSFLSFSMIL